VYLAKHCQVHDDNDAGSKNALAVKLLNPRRDCATAIEELAVIKHEITLMIHAGRHQNIVQFLGMFCVEDRSVDGDLNTLASSSSSSNMTHRWALVTEYVHGGDLYDAIAKQRFKEQRSHQVMADLLSALAHIHCRGIVHTDVKAENLLLTEHGRAVLADFGIAALVSDDDEMCKFCVTPGYAAPEVIRTEHYGVKVDSFSAGVTLYFMLSGHVPFEGNCVNSFLTMTMKNEVFFDSHPEFFKVSEQCKHFILQLLQKDHRNRPTAEQAASHIWCSSSELHFGQAARTPNAVDGCSSIDMDNISPIPEAKPHDQSIVFNHHDLLARSSRATEGEEQKAEEDKLDSTRDSLGQRGSSQGWTKRVTWLMSKLRANTADGQTPRSSRIHADGEMSNIVPIGAEDQPLT